MANNGTEKCKRNSGAYNSATTRQQISVYLIMILISLLVPPHVKTCTPHFSKCGGTKIFFSLANRVLSPPLLKPWHRPWLLAANCQLLDLLHVPCRRVPTYTASMTVSKTERSWVRNIYGNAVTPAFPLARHTFMGTPFPCKNIYGNVVPMRSRPWIYYYGTITQ